MSQRIALVAGVGPSLGSAIAHKLAADGWGLVLVGRDEEALVACQGALHERGVAPVLRVADLASADDLAALGGLGPVHAAVWVASAYAPFARVGRDTVEGFDAVHATTLRGPYLLARQLMPGMCSAGWGRFVVVGSVAGRTGGVGQAAYASAKAGLLGLVRTLAAEGGPRGVTANLLELGWVDTARTAGLDAEVRASFLARTALKRASTPEEVAAVVAFLASDAAAGITGASIPVDGGFGIGL